MLYCDFVCKEMKNYKSESHVCLFFKLPQVNLNNLKFKKM
jgi:hypothetical protein